MNQLKAGAALNYVVILLNTAVGLLYTPYMLRMMGQSEYGLYSLVASVIAYLTVLDLGLGNAVIRYTAKFRAEGKTKEQYEMFGMFLALYSIISVVALIGGMGLYLNVDRMFGGTMTEIELSHARIMMLILVFNLVVTFPMSIFGSIMSAYERFVFPKVINIIRIILNTVVMIVLLEMGYKAIAMVIIQTLFNVATLVINYLYCKYRLQIKIQFAKIQWGFLREVAIYSFWIFLNVIMDRVYWSTGQFLLGIVAGTAAIAVFAVAIQLQTMYMQFSTAISSVFLPKVTGMVALRNNEAEISELFIKTGRIQNIIMSLILFGFLTFGRAFITLWAGPEYNDAYIIASLFFISLYVPLIQNLGITILQARNQMKFRSLLYIGIAAVALVLQYYFAKMWGGIGCAIAIAGALFVGQGIIMNVYYKVRQGINIKKFWKEIAKMNIVPLMMSACFMFAIYDTPIDSWLKLALWMGLYAIMYIAVLYKFSMNKYERNLFREPIKRMIGR
ncbi:MAG: oligosaccharide flippase family protein [Prevotella sp.]|nr:oligosaccharide flippase family protein [Prevotella sp.]